MRQLDAPAVEALPALFEKAGIEWQTSDGDTWTQNASPPGDARIRSSTPSLVGLATEFVSLRFLANNSAAYLKWRERQGVARKPVEQLLKAARDGNFVARDYKAVYGTDPPAQATFEELFSAMWAKSFESQDARVTGIADGPLGVAVAIGYVNHAESERPEPRGALGPGVWQAGGSASHRNWFAWSPGARDFRKMTGPVWCAEVVVLCEFGDGSRRPLALTFFWDTQGGRWCLDFVNYYNASTGGQSPRILEY